MGGVRVPTYRNRVVIFKYHEGSMIQHVCKPQIKLSWLSCIFHSTCLLECFKCPAIQLSLFPFHVIWPRYSRPRNWKICHNFSKNVFQPNNLFSSFLSCSCTHGVHEGSPRGAARQGDGHGGRVGRLQLRGGECSGPQAKQQLRRSFRYLTTTINWLK